MRGWGFLALCLLAWLAFTVFGTWWLFFQASLPYAH